MVQKAGRVPGPVGTGAENLAPLPPLEFDPRTVQHVATRYTDYIIRAHKVTVLLDIPVNLRIEVSTTRINN